jgi:aminopeptidase-like protein
MLELITELYPLKRDIVSPGYDAAMQMLAERFPLKVHEYASGSPAWTWTIPQGWICHKATLQTLDGQALIDYADHPLHVVSYSLPFDGEVALDELKAHLHTHPTRPDAIPFVFKYYQRDWGLCCSQTLFDSLRDDRYRVSIESEYYDGTLKVGEWHIPGKTDECMVLAAHLCHPAQANDDLAGVAVALDVMTHLAARDDLRYSYKLLILPETIGSVAYLSHHEDDIPQMVGGLFLEMLGSDIPHHLQLSHPADTDIDRAFRMVFRGRESDERVYPFLKLITNDERQFNAPGVRVPMLSLARCFPYTQNPQVYPEYHSSDDTPAIMTEERLVASRDLALEMILALENDRYAHNHYSGEIMLSKYDLYISPDDDPVLHQLVFELLFEIDGTQRVSQIAEKLNASYQQIMALLDPMIAAGLVTLEGRAQ